MSKIQIIIWILIGAIILAGAIFIAKGLFVTQSQDAFGENITGDYSTSTNPAKTYPERIIYAKTGYGVLGSVTITNIGYPSGELKFYNATTTNRLQRVSTLTTSTIEMITFPYPSATSTFPLDITFTDGLIIDYVNFTGSSTITWR